MKIAVITDTHWGARNDNLAFLDYFTRFYREVFFPTLKERDIQHVLHLGDLTDRRKYINFVTAKRMNDEFLKPLYKNNIQLDVIVGNHDTFYKNTNSVNSIHELFGHARYDNMRVHWNNMFDLMFDDGCHILMVPWICAENKDKFMAELNVSTANVVMGHFEITGYEMMKGQLCDHGLDKNVFKKFDSVYSGHFHHPSSHSNITYLGAPYEMTWSDYEGKRGFHIFDTETREMEFIPNPFRMFHKIFYDDTNMTIEDVTQLDTEQLTNAFVKVIIKNKDNPYIFDLYLDRIQQSGAVDIKVVEDHMNLDLVDEDELVDEAQDTHTILNQYVDSLETKVSKDKIKNMITDLYQEAMNL